MGEDQGSDETSKGNVKYLEYMNLQCKCKVW